jgi:hypothetical protein
MMKNWGLNRAKSVTALQIWEWTWDCELRFFFSQVIQPSDTVYKQTSHSQQTNHLHNEKGKKAAIDCDLKHSVMT